MTIPLPIAPGFRQLILLSLRDRVLETIDCLPVNGAVLLMTTEGYVKLERAQRLDHLQMTVQAGSPAARFSFEITKRFVVLEEAPAMILGQFEKAYLALCAKSGV